ncbi:MAG: type I restriction-modification system subunit M N-terminal domain-containing protein [bacterium]|nr:type I restriction-modification system subunit M N-terminal domain-containing protein [bacterium]
MPTPLDPPNAQTRHRLRKKRWDAANELRGAVSENNYKNYIHPLVFVKHLSERYEIVREELSILLKDPQSEYYTTKAKDIKYVLEDEYRPFNTFIIPPTIPCQYGEWPLVSDGGWNRNCIQIPLNSVFKIHIRK